MPKKLENEQPQAEELTEQEPENKTEEPKQAETSMPPTPPKIPSARIEIVLYHDNSFSLETSPNMTFGMALKLLEGAMQRLHNAPLK